MAYRPRRPGSNIKKLSHFFADYTMTLSFPLKALILVASATIAAVSAFTTDPGQRKIGIANILHASPIRKPSFLCLTTGEEAAHVRYGESSREYRRTVFTTQDWVKHRSSDSLFLNLSSIFTSGIVRQLFKEISLVAAIATAVVIWNGILAPEYGLPKCCLPTAPFTLSSPALALLLVFKTNKSYHRWWDGRMMWGEIITQSRNVVRMGSTWTNDAEVPEELVIAAWLFPRSIMNKLSGPDDDIDYQEGATPAIQKL
jgi:hypothetical protein